MSLESEPKAPEANSSKICEEKDDGSTKNHNPSQLPWEIERENVKNFPPTNRRNQRQKSLSKMAQRKFGPLFEYNNAKVILDTDGNSSNENDGIDFYSLGNGWLLQGLEKAYKFNSNSEKKSRTIIDLFMIHALGDDVTLHYEETIRDYENEYGLTGKIDYVIRRKKDNICIGAIEAKGKGSINSQQLQSYRQLELEILALLNPKSQRIPRQRMRYKEVSIKSKADVDCVVSTLRFLTKNLDEIGLKYLVANDDEYLDVKEKGQSSSNPNRTKTDFPPEDKNRAAKDVALTTK